MNLDANKIDCSGLEPEIFTLHNGQPLYLFPDHSLELVKLDFTFEAGAAYQSKKFVASAANRLFTEGTRHHTAQQIAEFFDFRGIVIQKNIDTVTSSISIYSLKRYITELLPLLYEIFTEPIFPQQEFDVHIAKLHQTILANMQKTNYVARNLFYAQLYGLKHPYGAYATEKDCLNITLDDVRQFYFDYYPLSHTQFIISGNYDDDVLRCFNDIFGHIECTPQSFTPWYPPQPQPMNVDTLNTPIKTAVQSTVRVGRILPWSWDSIEYARFMILSTILGGYFGSRLMSNVREDKGYTYGINAQTQIFRGSIAFTITPDVGAKVAKQALQEIHNEMQRLCNEPVSKEELDTVRDFMLGDFLRSIDGMFERSERYKQMTSTYVTEQFTKNYFDAVTNVTPKQIELLACQVFQKSELAEIIVG